MHQHNQEPLLLAHPLSTCEVSVTIPVRNEERRLPTTLHALARQIDLSGAPLRHHRYEILVLANNCTDDTAAIARRVGRIYPTLQLHIVERHLPPHLAHVGYARRLLMDAAYQRMAQLHRPHGLIAMTDGDTRPAPTWLAAMLHEAAHGADGIGGNIVTAAPEVTAMNYGELAFHWQDVRYKQLITRATALLDAAPDDPWPRHHHHTGASLALTAAWYRQIGGIPAIPSSEDVALYRAMARQGARFRHSTLVEVTTSARQVGRARDGMADTLRRWGELARTNQTLLVEPWEAIAVQVQRNRLLRRCWQVARRNALAPHRLALLADMFQVDRVWLAEALRLAPSFVALREQIGDGPAVAPPIEIGAAIRGLEQWLSRA